MKKIFTNERLVIVILIILMGVGVNYHLNKRSKDEKKYEMQVKLTEALNDSVTTYQTKEGNWISEKRTLQGDLGDLTEENLGLNANQKALLGTIHKMNKEWNGEKEIWAAARIEYDQLIDSLNVYIAGATDIDTTKNLITFAQLDTTQNFVYDFDIYNVRPHPANKLPEIKINLLDFPNTQTITFTFDKNERKDYPISFSVMNTNDYYRVNNVESYAIPSIDKDLVNPSGWQKFGQWIKINGKYILVGAGGFALGAVAR